MQTTLLPPGVHKLSDMVIGRVLSRSRPARCTGGNGQVHWNQLHTQLHLAVGTSSERGTSDSATLIGTKRNLEDFRLERPAIRRKYSASHKLHIKDKKAGLVALTSSDYSRRYRERKQKYEEELRDTKLQLEQEINRLRGHRDRLSSHLSQDQAVWVVATEYFRVFRRGIHSCYHIHPTDLAFLRTTMSPDVLNDDASGIDALLKNWSLFTQWFPDVHFELKELQKITKHSLLALSTISFSFTAEAMCGAFPHLFKADGGSQCARTAARLRDQHFTFRCLVRFDWDEESKQVIRLQRQTHMVPVLAEMLGSLEDVTLMFDNARITPEGNIRQYHNCDNFSSTTANTG